MKKRFNKLAAVALMGIATASTASATVISDACDEITPMGVEITTKSLVLLTVTIAFAVLAVGRKGINFGKR